jgi:hypothetical protein
LDEVLDTLVQRQRDGRAAPRMIHKLFNCLKGRVDGNRQRPRAGGVPGDDGQGR